MGLAFWFVVVNAVNGDRYLTCNFRFVYGVVVTFGLACPLLLLIEEKEKWLVRIAATYPLLMTGVACLCLYAWMTGRSVASSFSEADISIRAWRMCF
jgi:hypothetical protein